MRLLSLSLVAGVAAASFAQAPRITPQGDPSIQPDSIYKLAVDPAAYSEHSVAILLDDGVVRVEADGRTRSTYRNIVQILKPEAEATYQERSFSYAPQHQKLTINWIRVLRPDGTVISAEPTHVQDSDVPAQQGDPVYSDRKVRRVSLTGVKAGALVDWSYTIEENKPFLPNDFSLSWLINSGPPILRSRYIVDVPARLSVRLEEKNLDFKRLTQTVGDRRVYTWARANVPTVRSEALASDSDGVYMHVAISSPLTWGDIGKWYAGNARSRYALTPEIEKKIADLVGGAATLDDSIRAVHRWVAQDVRYVSIALGLGGYQPRTPADVVSTGFGDCKDKATLFVAALAKLGVTAYPVLLNSGGGVDRALPSIDQFDHVIAVVERPSGAVYTDLTADVVPYGELPLVEQGEFGLVVHPDGTSREITFPRTSLESNNDLTLIDGVLSADGQFNGVYTREAHGSRQYKLRDGFRNPLDSTTRAKAANNIAQGYFYNAEGDSLQGFNGMDLRAEPRMRVRIKHASAAEPAGDNFILRLPFGSFRTLADAARELESEPQRRFPIDPERLWGYGVSVAEFRVQLPTGWKAQLPKSVTAQSAFGSYLSEYKQDGSELIVRRRTMGASGVQPPEKIVELIAWLRQVASDDATMIILSRQ